MGLRAAQEHVGQGSRLLTIGRTFTVPSPDGGQTMLGLRNWMPYPGDDLKVPYSPDTLVYHYDRTKEVLTLLEVSTTSSPSPMSRRWPTST